MENTIKNTLLTIFALGVLYQIKAQDTQRWSLAQNGGIQWQVKGNDSHMDHVEMSGFYISSIVHYGVENGLLKQYVQLVFPMLRTIPNDTHASLSHSIDIKDLPEITINGLPLVEHPTVFSLRGILGYRSKIDGGLEIRHQLFPSVDEPIFIDKAQITNKTKAPVKIEIPDIHISHLTEKDKGVSGSYLIEVVSNKKGSYTLRPGETLEYALVYSGRQIKVEQSYVSPDYELNKREELIDRTFNNLVFESPDAVLDREFAFAKLRAVESIYRTKGGLMHGPGGGSYYAAIWANDQAEYANPFFPYLGNLAGNESAINSFRHFARFMNDDYKAIPSSIIAEGTDYWNGAGDRGDMAMIAYGASRFALAYGKKNTARELWPLIEWCLEYCRRKVNQDGVVSSDSDELEGRFPAGDANLNTSCLYYDALLSASYLGTELGIEQEQIATYKKQAVEIKNAIESFFGATIQGYKTYRYYKGNIVLRAWICTPLAMNIFARSQGTIDALFSDKLWTKDGLASESGSTTFWDRATLYALRGVFAAGETKRALDFLQYYSERRLLGEHVPYPVEAYPEGNQRHLSAESALYCRVITEGLWGIRPVGFNEFSFSPKLPNDWNFMALKNIRAFNKDFSIEVKRDGNNLFVRVFNKEQTFLSTSMKMNETLKCRLL
ncbi:hypothetical protein K8352_12930 [Flavobacteriaceae bacterium F89]|uniref:Alpha-L-rhamnosidase six-hairpin glycosidase domain-containing protein n=1 Tax=Cerina litoralis TaxID=2874477 RepID=A0AAE3EWP2_9FLAO|nr:hypothetical protein [Cerina litoralis]MCG2461658.1 hypothetical protein [Cerina litoralis]